MAHKLEINCRYEGVFVRREEFRLIVSVTNIGDKTFSGGKFTSIRLFFSHLYDCYPKVPNLPDIPSLEPMSSFTSIPFLFNPYNEGLATLIIRVEANDGQPVELYVHGQEKKIPGDWLGPVYVSNRENMHIISLLEEVLRLLKGTEEKRRKPRKPK